MLATGYSINAHLSKSYRNVTEGGTAGYQVGYEAVVNAEGYVGGNAAKYSWSEDANFGADPGV